MSAEELVAKSKIVFTEYIEPNWLPLSLLGLTFLIAFIFLFFRRNQPIAEAAKSENLTKESTGSSHLKLADKSRPSSIAPEKEPAAQLQLADNKPSEPAPKLKLVEEEPKSIGPQPQLKLVPEPEALVPEVTDVDEIKAIDKGTWLNKLTQGLSKSRLQMASSLARLFQGGNKLDAASLEELHEILFRADIGVKTTDKLVELVKGSGLQNPDWPAINAALKQHTKTLLNGSQKELSFSNKPYVILVVGVNGVGKTTTCGKLAAHFLALGKSVCLCAADTYRAAAIDQLKVWGERIGVKVVSHQQGADPAAVAYDGVKAALARETDVLIIDTAGRLHNKQNLMDELGKINRVIGKDIASAPHETWLVVDASTGQNAVAQVKAFSEVVKLTGLIFTKLDGTAKGGVLLGIYDQFTLPVRYIGVGEKAADLRAFDPDDFVESLFKLDT